MVKYFRLASLATVGVLMAGLALTAQEPKKDGEKTDPKGKVEGKGRPGGGFPGGGGFAGGFTRTPPGTVLSSNLQTTLKLTDEQKKQIADMQKDVDAKLAKILTDDQKKQLKEISDRGPGAGFGGRPGGAGGPGGRPGGAPPKKDEPKKDN